MLLWRSLVTAAWLLTLCAAAPANVTTASASVPVSSTPSSSSSSSSSSTAVTAAATATTTTVVSSVKSQDEERPANVEQVPPPAPLITESAHKGYRMPGLYAFGSEPFYLERDPVTGAVDFSHPTHGDNNHRFSSKVSQANPDIEYDEELADVGEQIDRKDTLGSNRPNDLRPHKDNFSPFYHPASYPDKPGAATKDKFPLISSSYANTKVQGMGVQDSTRPPRPSTPTTPVPTYVSFKTSTEKILDFWPVKTTPSPPVASEYDYYDETAPAEEESEEPHRPAVTTTLKPEIPVKTQKPFVPTPLPEEPSYSSSLSPITPTHSHPSTYSRPYGFEEPFRPIYGVGEGNEEPIVRPDNKPIDNLPPTPSIYNVPPRIDNPVQMEGRPRPPINSNNNRPLIDSPLRTPSTVPQPPVFEASPFLQNEELETFRPPYVDIQGWKQATFTQTPAPDTTSTNTKVQFKEAEIHTPRPRPGQLPRQPLPQGYEPQRPGQNPPQQNRPLRLKKPTQEDPGHTQVDGRLPNRPQDVPPLRHQFNNNPNRPGPTINTRIDGPLPPQNPQPDGYHIQNHQQQRPPHSAIRHGFNRPNILPHHRPNMKFNYHPGNMRPPYAFSPPAQNRRQSVGLSDRLYPPPPPLLNVPGSEEISPQRFQNGPPLVGRRVGSQVATLQMMQNGPHSLPSYPPTPSSRDDVVAPDPVLNNPPQQVTPFEVRPTKYGTKPASSEDKSVFVVYANSGENQQSGGSGDVHFGTHGLQKPVPPSDLSDEEPVLTKRPTSIKPDFPYPLVKPTESTDERVTNKDRVKEEEINIIPNLQDYVPFNIKTITVAAGATKSPSAETSPYVQTKPTIQSFMSPQMDKNEFTVSAVMHTGSHPGGSGGHGTASVVVVEPNSHPHPHHHQHHPQHHQPGSSAAASPSPESFNFQAPFHASANVEPSPGNGWSAVKGSNTGQETLRPGLVDRADVMEELNTYVMAPNTKFDIENFKPELIGGFKPIYSASEESATDNGKPPATVVAEREERRV